MEQQMTERTIWQELNSGPHGEIGVIYDDGIALIDDGEHLWIADAKKFAAAIEWARNTPAENNIAHEAYASFWGQCPGWIVTDIGEGDGFGLDIYHCTNALEHAGFGHLIPAFWGQDEEAF